MVDESKTEILHAKFVVDADGGSCLTRLANLVYSSVGIRSVRAHSWIRKALEIRMEGKQTGNPAELVL